VAVALPDVQQKMCQHQQKMKGVADLLVICLGEMLYFATAGGSPFPHAVMRQIGSLVSSLPALDNAAFKK
jgi:GMP synthase-like glutamine amidotransferase